MKHKPPAKYVGDVVCSCGARWQGKDAMNSRIFFTHIDLGHRPTTIVQPRQLKAAS